MLVVIGIIGILAGVLMGTFSGGTESAHTARCLSNMRNLAAACHSASVTIGHYPPAGSFECVSVEVAGNGKAREQYFAFDGWISWDSRNAYARDSQGHRPTSHKASAAWNTSMYSDDQTARQYCLTNGALWKLVNGNHTIYICPRHEKAMKALKPNFSYVMNAFFGWDYSKGKNAISIDNGWGVYKGHDLGKTDKRLLFAEIPFVAHHGIVVPEDTSGEKTDSILQHKGCAGCASPESIGFNHKSGKQYYANIVFADGHTEKLVYPKEGMSDAELQDLTMWLCGMRNVSSHKIPKDEDYKPVDISFNGKKYDKMSK